MVAALHMLHMNVSNVRNKFIIIARAAEQSTSEFYYITTWCQERTQSHSKSGNKFDDV